MLTNTENEKQRIHSLVSKHKDSIIALGTSNEGSILAKDISMTASSCMLEPVQKRLPLYPQDEGKKLCVRVSLESNVITYHCIFAIHIRFEDDIKLYHSTFHKTLELCYGYAL